MLVTRTFLALCKAFKSAKPPPSSAPPQLVLLNMLVRSTGVVDTSRFAPRCVDDVVVDCCDKAVRSFDICAVGVRSFKGAGRGGGGANKSVKVAASRPVCCCSVEDCDKAVCSFVLGSFVEDGGGGGANKSFKDAAAASVVVVEEERLEGEEEVSCIFFKCYARVFTIITKDQRD